VYKAQIEHDTYDSNHQVKVTRVALDRGDSVAVLIYEKDTDQFLFTEQYRYPSSRRDCPFILEIVAGALDSNETPEKSAIREVDEEIGYQVSQLQLLHEYFPSPGMSAEKVYLFYAEVHSNDKYHPGGGSKKEKEDIKLVKLSRKRALEMLLSGEFNNSITIMGLQWFFLQQQFVKLKDF
jgi:ADP-ribose pyrophosphatase